MGEVTKRITRKNKKLESTLPLTISAQDGLVDQNTFFNKQVASKDVSNYYLLKKGEFAYNKSYSNGFPWGAIKRLDNYKMGVLSTLYISFVPTTIVSDFLVSYYDTNRWHKEVSMRAAEGARNHGLLNITAKDFFDTVLYFPSNEKEQKMIGSFFMKLENTMALHQQKINLLNQIKKGFLQKMFPKRGESIPEIRFSGFSSEWNHSLINDVITSHPIKSYISETEIDGKYEVVQQGDNPIVGYSNSKPYINYQNVILFGDHTVSLYKADNPFLISTDGVKILSDNNLEGYFFYSLLQKYRPEPQGYKRHLSILKNILAWYPENKEEQKKIGHLFKHLDDKITIHEDKIKALKQTKKALLQKMFI